MTQEQVEGRRRVALGSLQKDAAPAPEPSNLQPPRHTEPSPLSTCLLFPLPPALPDFPSAWLMLLAPTEPKEATPKATVIRSTAEPAACALHSQRCPWDPPGI